MSEPEDPGPPKSAASPPQVAAWSRKRRQLQPGFTQRPGVCRVCSPTSVWESRERREPGWSSFTSLRDRCPRSRYFNQCCGYLSKRLLRQQFFSAWTSAVDSASAISRRAKTYPSYRSFTQISSGRSAGEMGRWWKPDCRVPYFTTSKLSGLFRSRVKPS